MTQFKSTTHDERYAHVWLGDFSDRFTHATVFARRPRNSPEQAWTYAVALCVHTDTFNRKVGRQVARRRYFRGESRVMGAEFTYAKCQLVAEGVAILTAGG